MGAESQAQALMQGSGEGGCLLTHPEMLLRCWEGPEHPSSILWEEGRGSSWGQATPPEDSPGETGSPPRERLRIRWAWGSGAEGLA